MQILSRRELLHGEKSRGETTHEQCHDQESKKSLHGS